MGSIYKYTKYFRVPNKRVGININKGVKDSSDPLRLQSFLILKRILIILLGPVEYAISFDLYLMKNYHQ